MRTARAPRWICCCDCCCLINQSCCRRCCRQKNRSAGDWNLQRRWRRALALAIVSPSAAANAAVMRSSTILVRLRPPCRFIRPHTAWMSHLSSFFSRTNSVFSGGNFFRSPPSIPFVAELPRLGKCPSPWLLRQTGLAKLADRWDPRERGWPGGAEAKPLAKAKTAVEPRVVIMFGILTLGQHGKQKFQEPQNPGRWETKVPGTSKS